MDTIQRDLKLLLLGKEVAPCDYAVRNFLLPWHKKFFAQTNLLINAIRRQISTGFKDKRKYAEKRLDEILDGEKINSKETVISPLKNFILDGEKKIIDILEKKSPAEFQSLVELIASKGFRDCDFEYTWLEDMGFEWVETANGDLVMCVIDINKPPFKKTHIFIYNFAVGVLNAATNNINEGTVTLYYHNIASWLKNTDKALELNLKI
jgi:hypothetical protein